MKRLHSLVEKWPSAIVARSMVSEFSGGVLSPGTLANADSAGCGPPRMKFRRKVAYLATDLARWMEEHLDDTSCTGLERLEPERRAEKEGGGK